MSTSPGSGAGDKSLDLRAPPPSPMATGRKSLFANDSVLADFLRSTLKVPELVLPDSIVTGQKLHETPPRIDLRSFDSSESDVLEVIERVGRIGCFELVGHEISDDLISEMIGEAGNIFDLSLREKDSLRKSAENIYGFEERIGAEESDILGEEFVWGTDENLKLKLEGVFPKGYSSFSAKMEILSSSIEIVALKVLHHLKQNNYWTIDKDKSQAFDSLRMVCCIHKHNNMEDTTLDEWIRTLRYDEISTPIRTGSDYSHALGIHICMGFSEFHIYSKKGQVSFVPQNNAIIITLGDQIQAWSGGAQKHVITKPIFKGDNSSHKDNMGNNISVTFLYSPLCDLTKKRRLGNSDEDETAIITIGQQLYFAIIITIVYQFLNFVWSLF